MKRGRVIISILGVTRWDGGGKMGIKYARWMEELERMGDGG